MDIDIQRPTEYQIQQLCIPAVVEFIDSPNSFSGSYSQKLDPNSVESRSRLDGIKKESRVVGARVGARFRYQTIQRLLESQHVMDSLDRVFNFNKVTRNAKIVPPVITQVEGSIELSGDKQSARTTKRSWRIIAPARITTSGMNWRTYLDLRSIGFEYQNPISAYFQPVNRREEKAWRKGFCSGYGVGYKQADRQYVMQLSELRRDFIGMWRFRQLEIQGIVSSPQVIETRLGTLVNDDVVFIDERNVRISEATRFKVQGDWNNRQTK